MRYYYDGEFGGGGLAVLDRSNSALERAVALDPNLVLAGAQLAVNRADRGDLQRSYLEALALVNRRSENAYAHFSLGYALRYAGLIDEAARECDTAMRLDAHNYQFRSCARVFLQLGRPQRAMEIVHLDAGSQYALNITPTILLSEGKFKEAQESVKQVADNAWYRREFLEACLNRADSSELRNAAIAMESAVLSHPDSEPRYVAGTVLSFCGQEDAAARVLKSAIRQNYCAYKALQTDPLLAKLRENSEFTDLLNMAKQCQDKFLAQRARLPH